MSPVKLSSRLNISLTDAKKLFDEYAEAFPKLNAWLDKQAAFGVVNQYIRLPEPHCGIRWFPKLTEAKANINIDPLGWHKLRKAEGSTKRESMNTPIQGTGAIIVKASMIECRKLLETYDGYMLAPIHDELNFEIRKDQAEMFKHEASKVMIQTGNRYVKHVSMEVDAKITSQWEK